MHFFKRLTQYRCRFRAVLCERRHKLFRALAIPSTRTIGFTELARACPCWGQAGVSCRDWPSRKTGSRLMFRNTYSSSSRLNRVALLLNQPDSSFPIASEVNQSV
jgi:hypothetical protein